MNKFSTFNQNESSRQKSRFLASQQMLHRVVAILVLAFVCSGAWATDYVFVYNNGNYLANSTETAVTNSTSFIPNTCIWTCDNNSLDNSTSRALHSYGSTTTYLRGTTTNGNSPTTGNSQANWRLNNSRLAYTTVTGTGGNQTTTSYYLYYRGNQWRLSSTTGNNNNNYKGNGNGGTDYRATAYTVTTTSVSAGLSDFSISGNSSISSTGNYNYSKTNSQRNEAYTKFTFNNTTYYSTDNAQVASTTQPATTAVTTGYTWSLTGGDGYATVNSTTGVITVSTMPAEEITLTLTCSVTNGGITKTATKQILLTNASSVKTGQYVIYTGSNYLNDGTSGTTTFDPSTCLWTGSNGNKWHNDNNDYLRLRYRNNNYTFSLDNQTNGSNWSLTGAESGTTGMKLDDDSYGRYIRYNSGWGQTNDGNTSGTNVVFAVTELTYNGTDNTTTPTISAAINSANTGIQLSHTNVSGTYKPAYTDYVFYKGAHHYWYDEANHTSAPTAVDFSTTNATYTWSTESEEVTIDAATGLLTSNGNNTSELTTIPVRLTITHAASGYSKTVDYEVKLQDFEEQAASVEIGSHNVIQKVGEGLTLQGTLSGTYKPAFTNYVVNGQSHYLYNGTDYGYTVPAIYSISDGCTLSWGLSGEGADYATINATTGKITYNTDAGHDVVAVANLTVTHPSFPTFNITADPYPITLYSSTIAAPTIEVTEGTNKLILPVPSDGTTYFTTDGSDPKTSETKQTYDPVEPFVLTVSPTTVKAYSERWGVSSDVAVKEIRLKLANPEISISDNGIVTITIENAPDGTELRYTIDGTEPTSESTLYDSSSKPQVGNGATIKVIAVKSGYDSSDVASATFSIQTGVVGGTVRLNDYEDHNWAYYKGRDIKVGTASDAPNYKDKYKYTIYSPDPRNVKITYRGFNTDDKTIILGSNTVNTSTLNTNTTPHVSNVEGEGQNTFVFYKTLEKFVIGYFTDSKDWNGIPDDPTKENYPYTVISNPFSVRPSTGSGDSKKYYGFAGWKIISGGKYIGRGNGGTYTAASDGDVLDLDELIHFVNLDADVSYTPNCTSAEVVLEATWAEATVWSGNTAHTFSGKTYETNFIVASGNIGSIEQGTPCTIIGMNPDGTGDNSGTRTITGLKVTTTSTTDPYDRSNCVKVEWIRHGNGTFDANGRNLTMGRGIISSSGSGNTAQGNVYGNNTSGQNVVNTVKVESGYYSGIANINNKTATSSNAINAYVILGCDYDRALANYYVPASEINNNAYNIKLRSSRIYGPNGSPELNRDPGELYMRALVKSGVFASNTGNEYYFHTYQKPGQRYIEWEGGYNKGHIKGGSDGTQEQAVHRAMTIRMRGGRIDGQFACGSTSYPCYGDRVIAVTGGRIGGWIAPGSNCSSGGSSSDPTRGVTDGTSYIYFGGTAEINSRQFGTSGTDLFYQSTGGVIYGSGLGYSTNNNDNSGQMSKGSNIVLADDAYTERGIYGGGALGQTLTTANIFILGGRVGTGTGQIKDQGTGQTYNNVEAGVYGGACNRGGENSFIYMDGGVVESGIYGGSNINGTLSGNVTMQINGGQVGYAETEANANVHGGGYGQPTRVTGNVDVSIGKLNAESGATIYGDVYGGSALGYVNGTAASTTKHTNVTLNAGTINGSLYGGGLGDNTNAANVYGAVQVTVNGGTVNTTSASGSGAVYGCNNVKGAPQSTVNVDIYGTDPAPSAEAFALDAVYGGGNMAHYAAGTPVVVIHNCNNSIGSVYGGGNAADITNGDTDVTIWGGNVIGKVFGGGNGEREGTQANISGGTNVTIHGGTILEVYGGSNTRGTIGGTINVNVNAQAEEGHDACPIDIDNVYGGGNKAASAAGNITIGCAEHIGAVYGGANMANVTSGNINLQIKAGHIDNVFGGNNNSGVISGGITVNIDEDKTTYPCGMEVGNVYGAGNKADYTGNPVVNMKNGTVTGSIFGGGLSANVTGNTDVEVTGGEVHTDVYGGGALADVTGNTTVNLLNGTVNNVYGGGLGRKAVAEDAEHGITAVDAVEAIVGGDTNITLNGSVVKGNIFGCNNVNGTPKGHAKVLVKQTIENPDSASVEGAYHVTAVYGGGNQAAYIPTNTNEYAEVVVEGCDNSLRYVYGGGNAASTPKTQVTINGGTIFNVFGGGNGKTETGAAIENPGADVGYLDWKQDDAHKYGEGTTNVNIYGGTITSVFGGSNTKGNIRTASNVTLNDAGTCTFQVGDVYGAGNEAEMYGNGNLIIGCIPGLNEIYGGAKNANIYGDVSLTITNGTFGKVFGGNNLGGNISGKIKVLIEETGCRPVIIGDLYGGGNLAAYTAPTTGTSSQDGTEYDGNYPIVEVKSCTSIDRVFGGGLGVPANELELISDPTEKAAAKAKGVITGNPHVNIGLVEGKFANGGDYGTTHFPAISNKWGNKLGTIGDVYGGGNAADIDGDTYVNIATTETVTLTTGEKKNVAQPLKGVNISGNVYGGGNAAHVTGKTHVQVGKAPTPAP